MGVRWTEVRLEVLLKAEVLKLTETNSQRHVFVTLSSIKQQGERQS